MKSIIKNKFKQKYKIISAFIIIVSNFIILPTAYCQSPDWSYSPKIINPENIPNPIILFDEGHNNFHIANKSYYGFSKLLTADGYNIRSLKGPFADVANTAPLSDFQQQKSLSKILVIASPCQTSPCQKTTANALTTQEVTAIRQWVVDGGSLLLIIDHPPFAHVTNLASTFGIDIILSTIPKVIFNKTNLTNNILNSNSDLVQGRNNSENVSYVKTFTGISFTINPNPPLDTKHEALLELQQGVYQGVAIKVGAGRVYLSGEAAMFTTQLNSLNEPWGMHVPSAAYNEQYLKNIIHWLDGRMAVISGQVTQSDGNGVSGVTIEFLNQNGRVWSTKTDVNGYYISPKGVRNRTYRVTALSNAYNFINNGYYIFVGDTPVRNRNFSAQLK